jgi:hypothetical protein
MTHPSSLDLEAFAVGEPLPAHLAGHVEECSACGAFLEKLRAVVSAGPSADEADAAVARALARLTNADPERAAAPRSFVDPLETPDEAGETRKPRETRETNAPAAGARDPRRRLWLVGSSVVAPLAAAAAILLLTRSPDVGRARDLPSDDPRAPTTYKVQMGTLPPGVAPNLGAASGQVATEPDTQFKGGMQVAVVRDRGGAQARFSSTVHVRPGDRLRVEVALDHEQAILGAVLADDGSYLELMPQAVRGPGTHFSERSAKIDASPTRGTILIGSPEAVARARETKNFEGVTTLRVDPEAP